MSKIKCVRSIGMIIIGDKRYNLINKYRHFVKENDDKKLNSSFPNREDVAEIIDITMPVFYEELNNIEEGSRLTFISKVYQGDILGEENMVVVGELRETYEIIKSKAFVTTPVFDRLSPIVYRFYVSEVITSNYYPIDKEEEEK